jgi:hypothetical protein
MLLSKYAHYDQRAKLIDAIVSLSDEQLGGERSEKAKWLFKVIASECQELGYTKLARIMQRVALHYDYD